MHIYYNTHTSIGAFVTYKDILIYVHVLHVYILVCVNIWRQANICSSVTCVHTGMFQDEDTLVETPILYGVATISRLLKIIGLFCKRDLLKKRYSTKETYNFKEPTNRSHPLLCNVCVRVCMCMLLVLFWWCLAQTTLQTTGVCVCVCVCVCACVCVCVCVCERERETERERECVCAILRQNCMQPSAQEQPTYGVASVSRMDKIIRLFCKKAL